MSDGFELEFGVNTTSSTQYADKKQLHIERVKITDLSGSDSYNVNSPVGEYGILYVTSSTNPVSGSNTTGILKETSERPEVKIDWRVYTKNKDKPLIRDLIIEGLSLARTQKEEFNSVITSSDNGIEGLFSNLKNFIEN